jgi:glycosyltransferase involved in cell wall biosynthesis
MRILFFVRGLNVGGAQRQLVALMRGLHSRGHDISVAVFYGGGVFEDEVRAEGIPIHDLRKRGRFDTLTFMARFIRLVRSERPQIVHAYMGGANLFAAALKPMLPPVKLVWGIRSAMSDLSAYDWGTHVSSRLERLVSPIADCVIANSEAARRQAVADGMREDRIVVIPNGIDTERFRHDPAGRLQLREEWGIPARARLVGVVARLDPIKGHDTFLRAAAAIVAARRDVRFVCVGTGNPDYRAKLEGIASELGLSQVLVWAGERRVTRAIYSALDVAVLASNDGESFPNVVGEAMACGTPCVVSDTGDARLIVDDPQAVFPPRDPQALARAVLRMLDRLAAADGDVSSRGRARVENEYSLQKLLSRSERVLERLLPRVAVNPGSHGPAR